MKNYYRVMLGKKSVFAEECFNGNFIGVDFGIEQDLTNRLPEEWRAFNKEFIPVFLMARPEKTKIGAGLACGALWTVCKGIQKGDTVLCPDGKGSYRVAEVVGDYYYEPGPPLCHRRKVRWMDAVISRSDMSEGLQSSAGVPLTVVGPPAITNYRQEIENLIGNVHSPMPVLVGGAEVEDVSSFALEKHLEDFLVENWSQTELGQDFEIYNEDGEPFGKQYPTDTGPLDILAISKDKKRLLVVELKKGRASDAVVGQTLRYMGFVRDELAEKGQTVQGVIIAHEDDQRIRRALSMTPGITFYLYQVSFKLVKA